MPVALLPCKHCCKCAERPPAGLFDMSNLTNISLGAEIQDRQHIGVSRTSILRPEDDKLRRTGLCAYRLRLECSMAAFVLHECLSVIPPMNSLKLGMLVTTEEPPQACMRMSWSPELYLSLQRSAVIN